MELIDCKLNGDIISNLWSEDLGAKACLNTSSNAFSYGIYEGAVPLTIETKVINKYVYALFWGFQVCILFFYIKINSYVYITMVIYILSYNIEL